MSLVVAETNPPTEGKQIAHMALFDPDINLTYSDLKKFAVAVYSVWEPVDSLGDLLVRFQKCRDISTYGHVSAIRAAIRDNSHLFRMLNAGDYFLVLNQETGEMMRFVVDIGGAPLGFGAAAGWNIKPLMDPFGEILGSHRSRTYMENGIDSSFAMEDDDCNLEQFMVAWETFDKKMSEEDDGSANSSDDTPEITG